MPNLYVITQGAKIKVSGFSVIVEKDDKILEEYELPNIDNIVIYGNVQFSTQLVKKLAHYGKRIVLLHEDGSSAGRFIPYITGDIELRIKQFHLFDDAAMRLKFSRKLIAQKINNSLGLTQRYEDYHRGKNLDEIQDKLKRYFEKSFNAQSLDELLGIEGSAAREYFSAFEKMLSDKWEFYRREKHPATDEVNSLLSFGYVLLGDEIGAIAESYGFDPFLGFYHSPDYGRQSLAQDILEIFRAPIVDRLVLRTLNRSMLDRNDFRKTPGGVRLKKNGLKTFIREYEKILQAKVRDDVSGDKVSYRRMIQIQLERLKKFVLGEIGIWFFNFRKY